MARRRRRWRVAKWMGLISLMFLALSWAATLCSVPQFFMTTRHAAWKIALRGGCLQIVRQPPFLNIMGASGLSIRPQRRIAGLMVGNLGLGISAGSLGGLSWAPYVTRSTGGPGLAWHIRLPLWIPFVLIALPTAFLWRRDRRRIPPHCCQSCGYDLTGNTSGVCPECGQALAGNAHD